MPFRVGVYEFFARTIPGAFYIFTLLYLCNISSLVKINWQTLNNISAHWALSFAVFAFVVGSLMDPFSIYWHQLFKPSNIRYLVLEEFKALHRDWEIKIQAKDWPILLAHLRRDRLEVVNE